MKTSIFKKRKVFREPTIYTMRFPFSSRESITVDGRDYHLTAGDYFELRTEDLEVLKLKAADYGALAGRAYTIIASQKVISTFTWDVEP
jgi:hypothetical protein